MARKSHLRVHLFEKGADIPSGAVRPAAPTLRALPHLRHHLGLGGAGTFSDGKLTLGTEVGGWLGEYADPESLRSLITDVDEVYLEFGAPRRLYGEDPEPHERWADSASKHGLRLVRSPVRHLGTERSAEILAAMRDELEERVAVVTHSPVAHILAQDGRVLGVETAVGDVYESTVVIAAPGREGSAWLTEEAERLDIHLVNNAVDIGVRVEVPAVVADPVTDELYEPKLLYTSKHFEDPVRTFCMNPRGVVCTECWGDAVTVNGHSYADPARKTENTNFALLVSTRFTEPFKEPTAYGKHVARLANMLGKDILVQRLGDLRAGHRTTPERLRRSVVEPTLRAATPGDLSFALPYRICAIWSTCSMR